VTRLLHTRAKNAKFSRERCIRLNFTNRVPSDCPLHGFTSILASFQRGAQIPSMFFAIKKNGTMERKSLRRAACDKQRFDHERWPEARASSNCETAIFEDSSALRQIRTRPCLPSTITTRLRNPSKAGTAESPADSESPQIAEINADLQQLAIDARRTPERVGHAHLRDQLANLASD
jgi:hypothetical protein